MALDINGSKLEELQKRVIRNKVESIETKCVMNPEVIKSIKANADGLLIDAPCSGIGVLKRNPDTKWLMNPDRINKILTTQENILRTYSSLVKKGGELVYATCSILPVENRGQIVNFLKGIHDKWKLFSPVPDGDFQDLNKSFRAKIIGDISCDIDGAIPCTKIASTIAEPFFDYCISSKKIDKPFSKVENITIMSIDNLPSELPRDSSRYFGEILIQRILPLFKNDEDGIIEGATITKDGILTENYKYLKNYIS